MINVNQMTAEFAKMPDAALKQYAVMHKNDPYTMALVMSESNRRKQMRVGAQGQGGQQPTVVEQELSQMGGQPQAPQTAQAQALPEHTGIGTLPQQPMTMAEGGIVAFSGGGETDAVLRERMERDRQSSIYPGEVSVEELDADGKVPGFYRPLGALVDMATLPLRGIGGVLNTAGVRPLRALGANVPYIPESIFGGDSSSFTPYSDQINRAEARYTSEKKRERNMQIARAHGENMRPTMAGDPRILGVGDPVPGAGAPSGLANAPPTAKPPADKGGIKDLASAPRAPAAPAQSLIGRYEDIKSQLGTDDPYANQREAVGQAGVNAKQEALTAIEADNTKFANILKGKEAGLADRAANILKQSDTNTGLAFLNAGLSIMSTPGSLATAIGKGAKVGTESFAAGLDKINAAKEKLAEAQDRFEDLKINREEMSAKEIRAAKAGINDAKVAALGMTLDGMEKAGVRNQAAGLAILHGAVQESTNAASNAAHITAAGIAAAPGLERNKILKATQDTEAKVRKDYGTLQTKVMSDLSKDPTYSLEQDPIKKTAIYNNALRNALQNNPFLSQYAGNVGFGGSAGKVRELAGVDEAD